MKMGIFKKNSKRKLNASVTAIFAVAFGLTAITALMAYALATYTLTVSKTGTGANNGTVTSSPAGIDCGVNCSKDFNDGEMITLMASTPAGGFTSFIGWGGECSGTGNCTVTMDAAKNVTAGFSDPVVYQKCTLENPTSWGVRYRLTGDSVTVSACRAKCVGAGGNGNFAINKQLGWCLCGTERQPTSTQPPTTDSCDQTCPAPYSCGGTSGQFSVYGAQVLTAASVSITGRVLVDGRGGLANAFVNLTDSTGYTRITRTNPFGFYRFGDISAGQSVTISIVSKYYQFAPRQINVNEELNEVNFVSEP